MRTSESLASTAASTSRPAAASRRLGLLALTLATLAPVALPAIEPPPFGEVIDVPLVELEVQVTDRDGRQVADLTAADFAIFEDQKPVPIAHFERFGSPSEAVAARPSPGERAPEPRLHVAVFLDEVHVGAATRRRLLADLARLLDDELADDVAVMIAVYDGSTRVALPFTRDRGRLKEALFEAEAPSITRLLVERDQIGSMEEIFRDAKGKFGHGWSPCLHIQEFVDSYTYREFGRITQAVESFGRFVDSLAGIEGRKVVLHVSDGIPMRAGAEAAAYAQELCSGRGVSEGVPGSKDTTNMVDIYDPSHRTLDSSQYDTTSRWMEVGARANAGNVNVYTFRAGNGGRALPTTSSEEGRTSLQTAVGESENRDESLFLIAEQTGGRAFLAGADMKSDLATALRELKSYYRIAYTPPAGGGSDLRHVRVEIARPGIKVRHRQTYRPRAVHEQIADQLLGRLLYGGEPRAVAGLEIESAGRRPDVGGQVRARFRLKVPLAELATVERDGERHGSFIVFLAVAEPGGGLSPVRETVVPVRIPAPAAAALAAATPMGGRFVWEVEVSLRPGKQRLGVAVRDELSGETSYLVRGFDVASL